MTENMQTLGMIGGTSWHSTIEYYKLINQMAGKVIGEQANPPLIIHSINIELMREQNKEKINAKYLAVSEKLQAAGAKAIIICANTPHMVYDFVQPKIQIPILHIADVTGKEAEKLRLKKLGLLGNRPTMTGNFIPKELKENYGIETIIPSEEFIPQAHEYVSKELTQGIFSEDAKTFFKEQISLLKARGADGIILGCTELPLLIKENEVDIPTLATTNLHAQMAVDFILN
ncbi:aspartate/glutamate racemase family protein [Allomuricauda sp. NBRC 101325]|uniref:aspartate/glutamate racemase family protein n=1 Tax=Allomuricauda sp. NBRC 101325 TaxID=1113758 RepID=UPI00249FE0CE|nr:amino acid racemase [Muricauda sp. NBRC 101325]GLU45323.1 racemase [Muricauda sp. NBRC 101325]